MAGDELMFEALAYFRDVGADLLSLQKHARSPDGAKPSAKAAREALKRLEADGKAKQVGETWFLTPAGHRLAKGSALRPSWQRADPWILYALLKTTDGYNCDLRGLLAVTDFLNHATPTLEELHGALNRLAAGRLIGARQGAFYATPKARALYARVLESGARPTRGVREGLRNILECPCCGVDLKKVTWRINLDQAQLDAALAEYLGRPKRP